VKENNIDFLSLMGAVYKRIFDEEFFSN
jgi:hypothetical protein